MLQNKAPGGFSVCFSQKTFAFSAKNHPKGYRRRAFAALPLQIYLHFSEIMFLNVCKSLYGENLDIMLLIVV